MTKSTQTETPRTLAKLGALVAAKLPWSVAFTDMQAHAEQLETELAALAAENDALREALAEAVETRARLCEWITKRYEHGRHDWVRDELCEKWRGTLARSSGANAAKGNE